MSIRIKDVFDAIQRGLRKANRDRDYDNRDDRRSYRNNNDGDDDDD